MDVYFQHQVKEMAKRKGFNPEKLQPASSLILEMALRNGNANYSFAVNESNSNPAQRASETRLNQNDAFIATHVGIALKNEVATKPGSGVPQLYPNATVFTAEALNLAIEDLEAFFNSRLAITVDSKVWCRGVDMSLSRTVRTTQQSSATTRSEKLGDDGLIALASPVTLDGGKNNEIILSIASWPGQLIQYSTAGVTATVYAQLKFYGFLAVGQSGIGQINQ